MLEKEPLLFGNQTKPSPLVIEVETMSSKPSPLRSPMVRDLGVCPVGLMMCGVEKVASPLPE